MRDIQRRSDDAAAARFSGRFFLFFNYFAIKQALLREIIFENVPITSVFEWRSLQWVSCGALHFTRFRGNSLTKRHLAFIYFIYEAPKAKRSGKKKCRMWNWRDVEKKKNGVTKIQNNHMMGVKKSKWNKSESRKRSSEGWWCHYGCCVSRIGGIRFTCSSGERKCM